MAQLKVTKIIAWCKKATFHRKIRKTNGDYMGYGIIFKTKIVNLSDGRILHLSLQGCNNDNEGRKNDDWQGKIYTKEDFIKFAEGFKNDSKPSKESEGFDLKIGSRYCTYYDYGMHLLRMLKKSVTYDELIHSGKYVSFNRIDGVTVFENDKPTEMTMKEFDDYFYKKLYSNARIRYRINYTFLETEDDVIKAFDDENSVRIYISK